MARVDNFAEKDCQTCKHVATRTCQNCLTFNMWGPADSLRRDMCASCVNAEDPNEGAGWCADCCFKGIEESQALPLSPREQQVQQGPGDDDFVHDEDQTVSPAEEAAAISAELDGAEAKDFNQCGMKYDAGKDRWELLDGVWGVLKGVSRVLTFGGQKYDANSWQTVPNAQARYWAAACRHRSYILEGQLYDEESGLPHWAHFACDCLFVAWFMAKDAVLTPFKPIKK